MCFRVSSDTIQSRQFQCYLFTFVSGLRKREYIRQHYLHENNYQGEVNGKNCFDIEHMMFHKNLNTVNCKGNRFCMGNVVTYVQLIFSLFKPYAASFPPFNILPIASWSYSIKGILNDSCGSQFPNKASDEPSLLAFVPLCSPPPQGLLDDPVT